MEANEKKFERYALLLEQNVDMVDRCILAVNVAISQQVDWTKLALFIKEQKNNGDPLSLMIHKLKLEENKITLLLYDTYLADDAQTEAAETVDVDLSLTAHANATTYFAERKKAGEKREKTIGQASKALESAEKKAEVKMKGIHSPSSPVDLLGSGQVKSTRLNSPHLKYAHTNPRNTLMLKFLLLTPTRDKGEAACEADPQALLV